MTDNRESTFMAFVLGAAAGGIAALLLAPRSGSETRRRLRESADEIYETGEEKVRHASHTVKEHASDVADNVKEQVDQATDAAKSRVEAVKEAASEAKHTYDKELRRQEARG